RLAAACWRRSWAPSWAWTMPA
ncbi:hypothetical protein SM139_3342, partial [Stenotrophomonas maltophilia]